MSSPLILLLILALQSTSNAHSIQLTDTSAINSTCKIFYECLTSRNGSSIFLKCLSTTNSTPNASILFYSSDRSLNNCQNKCCISDPNCIPFQTYSQLCRQQQLQNKTQNISQTIENNNTKYQDGSNPKTNSLKIALITIGVFQFILIIVVVTYFIVRKCRQIHPADNQGAVNEGVVNEEVINGGVNNKEAVNEVQHQYINNMHSQILLKDCKTLDQDKEKQLKQILNSTYVQIEKKEPQNSDKHKDKENNKKGNKLSKNKGLINSNNSCYVNSALQCLSHSFELTTKILEANIQNQENNSFQYNILINYKIFLQQIRQGNSDESLYSLEMKEAVSKFNGHFTDFQQKDSLEFVAALLEGLNKQLSTGLRNQIKQAVHIDPKDQNHSDEQLSLYFQNKHYKDNNSIITKMFSGQFKTTIKCRTCNDKNGFRTFDSFSIVYLPISIKQKQQTLRTCIWSFGQKQQLNGDNAWFCQKCGSDQPSTKKTRIHKTGQYLIFGFKRFKNNQKVDNFIEFDFEFDLKLLLTRKNQNQNCLYFLYAVINHFGSLKGGHYTAYCKNQDDSWFEFNDQKVKQIDQNDVVTRHAYALFYRRIEYSKTT